jgi:outer membrane protein TolC
MKPAFEVPAPAPKSEWFTARPDLRLFNAQTVAARRVVRDSSKDWWPTANLSFDPQYITPEASFSRRAAGGSRFRRTSPSTTAAFAGTEARARDRGHRRRTHRHAGGDSRAFGGAAGARDGGFARAARDSARRAAENANEVLKITIVAFDAGASTNIEVIDAQRSARDLETAVTQAEDAVRQARLDLLVALGRFPR